MEAEFCVNGSSASNDQQFLGHAAFEAITFTRPPPKKATDASQKCMAISHMPSMKMGSCPPHPLIFWPKDNSYVRKVSRRILKPTDPVAHLPFPKYNPSPRRRRS